MKSLSARGEGVIAPFGHQEAGVQFNKPNRPELKPLRWREKIVGKRDGKTGTEIQQTGTLVNTVPSFPQLWSFFTSFASPVT